MSEIIRLENVIKVAENDRRAVNGINISINRKERVAIHGGTGSGKTTLMLLIAGMEPPSSGKVFVLDKAVHEMDADTAAEFRNLNFGIMRRNPGFMRRMTLQENIELPLAARGMAAQKREWAASEQLKTMGLSYAGHAHPIQLSRYEMQVASIARALVAQPKILLMDEITADLTSKEAEQIIGIIHAIWQFGDLTIVSFSDNSSSAFHADRYFTLDQGKIQEDKS